MTTHPDTDCPRLCYGCGQPLSGEVFYVEHFDDPRAWHIACEDEAAELSPDTAAHPTYLELLRALRGLGEGSA